MAEVTRAGATRINERTLNRWADAGRDDVRTALRRALKEFPRDGRRSADSELSRLLYELVWIVLRAQLTRQEVVELLKEVELMAHPAACDALTDLLWVVGNEVEASELGKERHSSSEWRNLCRLVKAVADEELVPLLTLKASLEFDLLHEAELAPEPQVLLKKMVRINTKTLYTQVKYNLLREETEGFSKVLALLHTGVTTDQLEATTTDLLALIGFFDLDANRVLDLVLDAYEMHPRNDCFAQLLAAFKRESLPHVMGFKFQFYKRDPPASGEDVTTPRSLYRLAATLLDKELLQLDALFPHLAPTREAIVSTARARTREIQEQARAFGKVSLAGKKEDAKTEVDEEAVAKRQREADHNQVYGLIMGLLEIGALTRAFELISWFKAQNVDPMTFTPLATQLCAVVSTMIAQVYAPLSSRSLQLVGETASSSKNVVDKIQKSKENSYVRAVTSLDECVEKVFPIVEMLGPQLHHDQFLFSKLLRIVGRLLDDHVKKPKTAADDEEDALVTKIKSLVAKTFLPALSLQSCNPSTAFLLWDLLKGFPCDERYRLYLQWLEAYATYPELRLREAEAIQSTRGVMRRLTADRAKLSARNLTHAAHSNPLIVFRTMLRQIQSYDNLIQPVVESFKFVTPLGMDALSFVLVSELSKPQKSMKSDGTHVSLWLTSLASFSGSFYRRYPNVELAGLLQYLIQRLQNWASVDLVVLSELLTKMGSCISLEDISESQLEALAGGPHLGYEPSDPKFTNRRAIPRLRDALIKRDLALPLCILICQMRSRIEFHEDRELPHLKLLGRVYDTCQMTLSQLLQFLNGVVDPLVYRKMLPSVTTLVREFHVPAELAMTLCRPAMRSDDPVLQTAPRGIHAPANRAASNGAGKEKGVESGEKNWFMYSSEMLKDVGQALSTSTDGDESSEGLKDPFTGLTREMYVTFWGLTLYDIHIPFQQYEAEILRLRNSVSSTSSAMNSAATAMERKKLKEKAAQMIDKLTTEQKDQVAHRKRVYERLEDMKSKFFQSEPVARQTAINELLQKCVIPRALLSPEDALFAAKFMERLHLSSTPLFSTLQYVHKVNMKLSAAVLCATEREAGNFGIFLKETLGLALRWFQSGATYDDEAVHGKVGFSLDLTDPKKKLAHRQYKQAYARWHRQLELVYTTTLASGEYMQIRNTLVVLTKLIDVFPSSRGTAETLLAIVEKLTKEDREDIKIMAKRYFALLTKRKGSLAEDKLLSRPRRERDGASAGRNASTPTPVVEGDKKEEAADEKKSPEKEERLKDDDPEDDNVKSKVKPTLNRGDSQHELESGEIVGGGGSTPASSRLKRRDSDRGRERGRSSERERGGRSGGHGGRSDSSVDAGSRERRSEERRGRRDHRDREASPTGGRAPRRSSSTNSRATEAGVSSGRERSGSAARKHERSSPAPIPRRSRSRDSRTDERGSSSDGRRASREREHSRDRGRERGARDWERNERGSSSHRDNHSHSRDRNDRNDRNERGERMDRNERGGGPVHGRENTETEDTSEKPEVAKRPESAKPSSPVQKSEPTRPEATTSERESGAKSESSGPDGGRKRARPSEPSEAALRRQLTAEKKSQEQERKKKAEDQTGDRERGRGARPPTGLKTGTTASQLGGNASPGANAATKSGIGSRVDGSASTSGASNANANASGSSGQPRKIVSLVSSSRKREREAVTPTGDSEPTSSVNAGAGVPEGKRRREGGGGSGNGGRGDGGDHAKRGQEEKRYRKKNRAGDGNQQQQQQPQQQQQQMRARQERMGSGGGGGRSGDRRGTREDRAGGGGGGGRRRDRNDFRGGRR